MYPPLFLSFSLPFLLLSHPLLPPLFASSPPLSFSLSPAVLIKFSCFFFPCIGELIFFLLVFESIPFLIFCFVRDCCVRFIYSVHGLLVFFSTFLVFVCSTVVWYYFLNFLILSLFISSYSLLISSLVHFSLFDLFNLLFIYFFICPSSTFYCFPLSIFQVIQSSSQLTKS